MKMKFLAAAMMFVPMGAFAALPHVGFYQTIDDETSKPKSIVALYEYKNGDDAQLAGRIIALYDEAGAISETLSAPVKVAEKVKGTPKMVGLDIIWNMDWKAKKTEYTNGEIMDPKKGNVYSSVIWQDKADTSKLKVRGKIGPFGRTQTWNVLQTSELPADLQKLKTADWQPVVVK